MGGVWLRSIQRAVDVFGGRVYMRVSDGRPWSAWWGGHEWTDFCTFAKASCWMCLGQTVRAKLPSRVADVV